MPNQLENSRMVIETRAEGWQGEEGNGRWDVGLGERLAQTIWKWLGREVEGEKSGPSEEPEYRRAA